MSRVAVTRRDFLQITAAVALAEAAPAETVETVKVPIPATQLGVTLIHEHVMVDFIGADQVSPSRYNPSEVFQAALPRLKALRDRGCTTLVECTPAYLGRDPDLLRRLSEASGLHMLTNTGYYGAANGKYLPKHAFTETAEQLASRWIAERRSGIDPTRIRPAFMKIGVNAGKLSDVDTKLIRAAAICHAAIGLRIHVHTGDGIAAQGIVEVLSTQSIHPSAYVWVHAQNEKNRGIHQQLARAGAWLEFDGINSRSADQHAAAILDLAAAGLLTRVLISQDSGWYHVGEPAGGQFNAYTYMFDEFLPLLKTRGLTEQQLKMLTVSNPAKVLTPMPA
jgi:predicted metal-dependent phosphotriesterase family hydrolase